MQQTQNELKSCRKKQQDWVKEEERREGIHIAIILTLARMMARVCFHRRVLEAEAGK